MIGNIMVQFTDESHAKNVQENLSRRRYRGKLVMPEFSYVEDFDRGSCGRFAKGFCQREGNCNFLHMKKIRKKLEKELFKEMYKMHPEYLEKYKKDKEG